MMDKSRITGEANFFYQWVALVFALLMMVGLIAYTQFQDHRRIDVQERERLTTQAEIVEKNVTPQLLLANHVIEGILHDLPSWQAENDGFKRANHQLQVINDTLIGIRPILVIKADGTVIASSNEKLIGMNFSHRDYFRTAIKNPDPKVLYVSAPFTTVLDTFVISLFRIISGPKGEFAGIVIVSVVPEYFANLLDSVRYASDFRTRIIHGDGKIFLSSPHVEKLDGMDLSSPGSFFMRHRASGLQASMLTGISSSTGDERMMALRTIQLTVPLMDKPLVVAVSRDLSSIFAPWRRDVGKQWALLALLVLVATLGLYFYQKRQRIFNHASAVHEAERIRNAEQYRALFQASLDGFCITDSRGRIVDANESICRMLGYSLEELLHMGIQDIEVDESPEETAARIREIMNTGQAQFETRRRRKDGKIINVEVGIQFIAALGERFFCFVRDITERKQMEEARDEALTRLQKIASRLPGVVLQFRLRADGSFCVPYASEALRDIYRVSPEDVRDDAEPLFAVVHPDDFAGVVASMETAARNLTPWQHEYRLKFEGEPDVWLLGSGIPEQDADGSILGHGFITDITERKQAEAALQESEKRFRILFEGAPDAIFLADPVTRKILDANQAACCLLGKEREEIVGIYQEELHPPQPGEHSKEIFDRHVKESQDRGATQPIEDFVLRSDGVRVPVEILAQMIEVHGQAVLVGTFRDITERKRIEADLLAAKSAAEKANQAKSRFLAAASHDLRQPLSALALYFDVLKNRIAPGSEDLVVDIQDCVDSLTGLLSDLLDVSKLEAGVVTVKLADIALNDLIATLVSVHSAEARLKGLQLRERCSGMVVRTDPQLLQRILGNLIANAIHFTSKGGVLVACRRHQGRRWIEIWDTGIGIPEDQTGIIFEEFRQLGDEARNRGSGLGLAIVARTARLLGLEIRVRSRPGRGSMFAVELPAERANVGDSEISPPAVLPWTGSLRIGLVEDHPDVLRALVLVLKSLGHEIIAASCGSLLIENLGGRAPDMVISDYRLAEGETGFDVIVAARDLFGEELPAFLITGDTDPAVVRSMAERGIEVLFKPLQVAAMRAAIGKATARRRGP